jgi:hypothetical protein
MSTIRHPVQNHSWWYAAVATFAVIALLAVLMAQVFTGSDSGGTTKIVTSDEPGKAYAAPCFMHRPGNSVELTMPGCQVAP